MGRLLTKNGWIYEIAQWYPRMCVFDNVYGWNTLPYLGQGEFYLEYGDIEYSVNVPSDELVGGSGELLNPAEVLTPKQQKLFLEAKNSDKAVMIRSLAEAIGNPSSRPASKGASPGNSVPPLPARGRGSGRPLSPLSGTPRGSTCQAEKKPWPNHFIRPKAPATPPGDVPRNMSKVASNFTPTISMNSPIPRHQCRRYRGGDGISRHRLVARPPAEEAFLGESPATNSAITGSR